jgi:hypothetical protein
MFDEARYAVLNRAEKVHELMMDCLNGKEEGAVMVEGIVRTFGLNPEKLTFHHNRIKEILDDMQPPFHVSSGGGWTFLNLCEDRDGVHWAEHPTMESMVALGIGAGMVKYCMPKEMWSAFPGGMPYLMIDTSGNLKK